MTSVHDIESALWQLAPRELARSWDNVGLLVGRPDREVRRVLVALDITEAVAEEAEAQGADLIVSHHPVMNCHWHMVQTLRSDDRQGRLLRRLRDRLPRQEGREGAGYGEARQPACAAGYI